MFWKQIYINYKWINSMEKNPSPDVNKRLASQKISWLLWNSKVLYCVHYIPLLYPILTQINPLQSFKPHYFKINIKFISSYIPCNIVL
jgi:hypothetical protein